MGKNKAAGDETWKSVVQLNSLFSNQMYGHQSVLHALSFLGKLLYLRSNIGASWRKQKHFGP